MKRKHSIIFFVMGLAFMLVGCSSAEEETTAQADSSEQEAAESEDRIIVTTVALVEFMERLDLDLVGVPNTYKELPDRYADAEEVGYAMSPDLEMILSLKPTEVMSVTALEADLEEEYGDSDIQTTYLDLESIDGMHQSILDIGERYDREEQAAEIVQEFEDKVSEIEEVVKDKDSPTVLILLGVPGSYLVGTEKSYIGDLVKRSGGQNVVTGEDVDYLSSNTEYLYESNPDIILRAAHGMPDEVVDMFNKEFQENDIWKHFDAVQNDRVYDLEETLFGTTGNLAAVEALDELLEMLYPEEE